MVAAEEDEALLYQCGFLGCHLVTVVLVLVLLLMMMLMEAPDLRRDPGLFGQLARMGIGVGLVAERAARLKRSERAA